MTNLPEFGPPDQRVVQYCDDCATYTSHDRYEDHYGPADVDGLICRECCTFTGQARW